MHCFLITLLARVGKYVNSSIFITNDVVRFFLMLNEFIPFGDDVDVNNKLHNAEWMSLDMAKQKYEELKRRL